MPKLWFYLLVILSVIMVGSCSTKPKAKAENAIPIVDFDGIEPLLNRKNDTLYVINFWATWCTPCVKELPYLEAINAEYANKKVKVILVNLDFPNHYEDRLLPFIVEKNIKSKVIMLDDPNANRWINLVSPNWSGSIPATLIYNKDERKFFEKSFELDELKQIINEMI
jgi:thiol-disulfide isomerase/thioredoxin